VVKFESKLVFKCESKLNLFPFKPSANFSSQAEFYSKRAQARIQVQLEALRFKFPSEFQALKSSSLARVNFEEAKSELVRIATPGMDKLIYLREILLRC
jgi:hypothetical protein